MSRHFYSNPQLSRISSNLSRALLGSASDDASIARGRYNDALANQQEQLTSTALEAAKGLAPYFQSQLGIDNMSPELAESVARNFLLRPNLQQTGTGVSKLSESQQRRSALSSLLNPDNPLTEDQTRNLLSAITGKLPTSNTAATAEFARELSRYEPDLKFGKGGQGDRDTSAQEATKQKENVMRYGRGGSEERIAKLVQTLVNAAAANQDNLRYGEGGQGDRDTRSKESTKQKENVMRYGRGGQGDRDTQSQASVNRREQDLRFGEGGSEERVARISQLAAMFEDALRYGTGGAADRAANIESGDRRYTTDTRFGPGGTADRASRREQSTARQESQLRYGAGGQGDRNTQASSLVQLFENLLRFGKGGQGDRDTAATQQTAQGEDQMRFGKGGQGDRDTSASEQTTRRRDDLRFGRGGSEDRVSRRQEATKRRGDDLRLGKGGQGDRDTEASETTKKRRDDLRYGEGGQGDRDAEKGVKSSKAISVPDSVVKRFNQIFDDIGIENWDRLPEAVKGQLRSDVFGKFEDAYTGRSGDGTKSISRSIDPLKKILSKGMVRIDPVGPGDFSVPKLFIDNALNGLRGGNSMDVILNDFAGKGYSQSELDDIKNYLEAQTAN